MEEIINYYTGGLLGGVSILLGVINKLTNQYFSNWLGETLDIKGDLQANRLFNILIVSIFVLGSFVIYQTYSNQPNIHIDTNYVEAEKTDSEVILDASEIAWQEIQEGVQNKRERDAAVIENREKRYAIKIGDINSTEKSIVELFKKMEVHFTLQVSVFE